MTVEWQELSHRELMSARDVPVQGEFQLNLQRSPKEKQHCSKVKAPTHFNMNKSPQYLTAQITRVIVSSTNAFSKAKRQESLADMLIENFKVLSKQCKAHKNPNCDLNHLSDVSVIKVNHF